MIWFTLWELYKRVKTSFSMWWTCSLRCFVVIFFLIIITFYYSRMSLRSKSTKIGKGRILTAPCFPPVNNFRTELEELKCSSNHATQIQFTLKIHRNFILDPGIIFFRCPSVRASVWRFFSIYVSFLSTLSPLSIVRSIFRSFESEQFDYVVWKLSKKSLLAAQRKIWRWKQKFEQGQRYFVLNIILFSTSFCPHPSVWSLLSFFAN